MAERGEPLSDRELDVLKRMAAGEANKAIADGLLISPLTVKTHLRNIYTKLGVSTRTEAMTVALQQGLLIVPGEAARRELLPAAVEAANPSLIAVAGNGPVVETTLPAVEMASVPATASGRDVASGQHVASGRDVASGHRWRAVSLALLALLLLTAAAFAFIQRQSGTLLATSTEEPFAEQALGETRWLSSRPLPEGRAGRAVVAVGLDVYAIGGETTGGVSDTVQVFDTRRRVWRRVADKPTAVGAATAAELFGEVYVPGGLDADDRPTAIVEAYSPAQDAWRRIASLPQPVADGLALTAGGFLYLIGGRNENGALDSVYLYDPVADSWRPVASLPAPRAAAAGGALTGRLFVVGGADDAAERGSCFVYNPPSDAWDTCPDMLQPRADAGATVLLNKLYVIGGTQDPAGHGEVFDPNSATWTVLNPPPDVGAWLAPGVTHVETRIYAVGGRQGDALSAATLIYAPIAYQTYIPAAPSNAEE